MSSTGPLPALRGDVEIVPRQEPRGALTYLLTAPGGDAAFEMTEVELFICRQLDGRSTVEEVQRRFAAEFGEPVETDDVLAFVEQLRGEGCLVGEAARGRTLAEMLDPEELLPYGEWRWTRGDGVIDRLATHLAWLFSRPVQVGSVFLVGLAVMVVFREWSLMLRSIDLYWGLIFFVSVVMMSAVVVNAPRSILQGVHCKRSGGYVTEIGVVFFYYFIPRLYCRFADLAWLRDRDKMIVSIFSGVWYQVCVWAFATLCWAATRPGGLANALWLSLSVAAGAGLLVFVLNPLVKMDGYHMLVAWFDLPLLRRRAVAAFGAWLGGKPLPEPLTAHEKAGFLTFGALVFVFTNGAAVLFLVMAGQGLAAAAGGAGFLTAVAIGAFMFHRILGTLFDRPIGWVRGQWDAARRRWGRKVWWGLALLLLLLLPYPYETGGPFTMFPVDSAEVHCEVNGGSISEVLVAEGDTVDAGQPLAQLDRSEVLKNLEVTEASLDETRAQLRFLEKRVAILEDAPDIETVRALEAEARKLERLVEDFRRELALTTLRAPIAGVVVTPNVELFEGRYLRKGDLFATVEHQDRVRVEIHVPEGDVSDVAIGARVKVVAWAYPGETFVGEVLRIAPIASTELRPPQFSRDNTVRVITELPNDDGLFRSQITGFAKIKTGWKPVWFVATRLVLRWIRVQVWYWIP